MTATEINQNHLGVTGQRSLGRDNPIKRGLAGSIKLSSDANLGTPCYYLPVGGFDQVKVIAEKDPEAMAMLRAAIPGFDDMQPRDELHFDPAYDVEYKKFVDPVTVLSRLVLVSIHQRPGKPKPPVVMPAWAQSIEEVMHYLAEWNAGEAWTKEVLGADLSTWPATREECKAKLDANRIQPPPRPTEPAAVQEKTITADAWLMLKDRPTVYYNREVVTKIERHPIMETEVNISTASGIHNTPDEIALVIGDSKVAEIPFEPTKTDELAEELDEAFGPKRVIWTADTSKPGQSQNIAAWKHFEREVWAIDEGLVPPEELKIALAPYRDIPTAIETLGWPATREKLQARLDYLKAHKSTQVDAKETTVTDNAGLASTVLTAKDWADFLKGKCKSADMLKALGLGKLSEWHGTLEDAYTIYLTKTTPVVPDEDVAEQDGEPAASEDINEMEAGYADPEPPAALAPKSEVMLVDPANVEVVRESAFTGRALLPTSQEWQVQSEIAVQGFKSGLLKDVRNEFAARFIVETGRELGIPPSLALRKMYIVHGQIAMAAELMWALALNSGKLATFQIEESVNSCTVTVLRKGASKPYTTTFSVADAAKISTKEGDKTIKLSEKYNWRAMPGVMCKWRAISTACRTVFPDVTLGLYSREEMEDASDFKSAE